MISRIVKRDGKIVDFNLKKITDAIYKALKATNRDDYGMAKRLSGEVLLILERKYSEENIPGVEDIQDVVEYVLLENKLYETAKAYIIYRQKHKELRELRKLLDPAGLIEAYLYRSDWLVRENSNMSFSLQGMNSYVVRKVVSEYWLTNIYPKEIAQAHRSGDFHIHDLDFLGAYTYFGKEIILTKISNELLLTSFEQLYELIAEKEVVLSEEDEAYAKYPKELLVLDKNGWTRVLRVVRKRKNRPMLFVKNRGGRSVIVTDNHPMITENGEKEAKDVIVDRDRTFTVDLSSLLEKEDLWRIQYIDLLREIKKHGWISKRDRLFFNGEPLDDLRDEEGDGYIHTIGFISKRKIELTQKFGYFIGFTLAEGYLSYNEKEPRCVSLTQKDKKLLLRANEGLIENGMSGCLIKREDRFELQVKNPFLRFLFEKIFKIKPGARNKTLPINILSYNKDFVEGLIAGILDGDGSIDTSRTTLSLRISSRSLLEQMALLMQLLGFIPRDRNIEGEGSIREFNGKKIVQNYPIYGLSFRKTTVGISSEKYIEAELSTKAWHDETRSAWHKIINKKEVNIPDEFIYDITTESGTLVVNGMWNHNCVGWDIEDLLLTGFGGVPGKVESKPAKHFRSALGQVVNFFFTLQGESAGAQAFSFDGQTPIVIKRDNNIEFITLEMLFNDYKHHVENLNESEVIFTGNIYRRYAIDDADKRVYLDSRLPTEPILFQFDQIEVLTENGFMPLKAISRHKIESRDDELLMVETEDGNILRITRSHPVILSDGAIKRADELSVGDELLSTNSKVNFFTEKIKLQSDFAYLIGFMIAEGCWGHQTKDYTIVSQKKNTEEREKIEHILKKLKIPYYKDGEFNIVFGTTRIGRFIRNHLKLQEGSYRKNLPAFVFELTRENIGDIISGIIDGDGSVDKERIVRISSTSYTLLMQLKQILGILGINSTTRYIGYKNAKENWKDVYVIRFRVDEEHLQLFRQSIKLQNVKTKTRESPKFSSKVVKIAEAKNNSEYVYDITTENEYFLVNNIVVHNSNFDTYLSPFIRYDNMDYKQVKQALQEFLFNMNVPTRVGFQCMSEDTEILGIDGWKKYNEVKEGDIIATFNVDGGFLEYLPVKHVFAREYKGKMYNLKNRISDQLISPGHRIVRRKFDSERYVLEKVEDVLKLKSPFMVPIGSGGNVKGDVSISKDVIKLIAWVVSEGSLDKSGRGDGRISIYQSKVKSPYEYEEIIATCRNLGLKYTERTQQGLGDDCNVIRFDADSTRKILNYFDSNKERSIKFIPDIILNADTESSRLFIETYIQADGYEGCKIVTTSEAIRDGLLQVIVNAGYGATVSVRKPDNELSKKDRFIIRVIKHRDTYIEKIEEVEYEGIIWCPNTDNETVVARRNGKIFITGNTPFTNVTLDLKVPDFMKHKAVIVGGKLQNASYGEFQKEMDMFNRAFAEVMAEGDAKGRPFTFPIPTYNITKDFEWDNENYIPIWEMTRKYGIPYFSNFVNSDMKPEDARSMCCRLRLDLKQLAKRGGGLFGSNPLTGSIGVVTINMPRIAYLSKTEGEFFERLERLMEMAKESLVIKRKIIEKLTDAGLYPYSRHYLRNVKERFGEYWKNHFSTIGLIGMNEACLNFEPLRCTIGDERGKEFALKVLDFMRGKLLKFQEEEGNNYNLEATPAEGTSHSLALLDKERFPDIITQGSEDGVFYTNSSQLPVDFSDDIFEVLDLQDEVQCKYTGGTVIHIFLGESLSDYRSVKNLARKVIDNYRLPYFTITPTFSICPIHGYIPGEHPTCPVCEEEKRVEIKAEIQKLKTQLEQMEAREETSGKIKRLEEELKKIKGTPCEVFSRSVGYLRPVSQWNRGKQEEFKERKTFKV